MQLVHVQRRPGAEGKPLAQIALFETSRAPQPDIAQHALNDLERYDTVFNRLVWDQHARVDVSPVDIGARQNNAQRLDVLRPQWTAEKWRRKPAEFFTRNRRVPDEAKILGYKGWSFGHVGKCLPDSSRCLGHFQPIAGPWQEIGKFWQPLARSFNILRQHELALTADRENQSQGPNPKRA